jgi:hypothetical protein
MRKWSLVEGEGRTGRTDTTAENKRGSRYYVTKYEGTNGADTRELRRAIQVEKRAFYSQWGPTAKVQNRPTYNLRMWLTDTDDSASIKRWKNIVLLPKVLVCDMMLYENPTDWIKYEFKYKWWGCIRQTQKIAPTFFYLKTEAEPASETLFLKEKKHCTMDKVQKQDSSKITDFLVWRRVLL